MTTRLDGMRIAIVYDCLFPYTVGGGERWYRQLADGLVEAGASVTYLTRTQWEEAPVIPGLKVVAISGPSELYDNNGVRTLGPGLRFGWGTLRWLARHRRDYDVVQVASFPFFSLLAVRAALAGSGVRVVVDWFEVWSPKFWREYAGTSIGVVGYAVQWVCMKASPEVVVLSESNARRLRARGHRSTPLVLAGLLPSETVDSDGSEPVLEAADPAFVLFAGRHITDKGVDLLPRAFAAVHRRNPEIRYVIAGDGPLRSRITDELQALGLTAVVEVTGFVTDSQLDGLIRTASCVVVPSRREGYGLMVVDSMGKGTPVVTAAFDENLAVDHIDDGNGRVASPPTPENLAEAIMEVISAGEALRRSTFEWYTTHAPEKSIYRAVEQMVDSYAISAVR